MLSTPVEMRLPLRWIAILYGHVDCSMALTSGIHSSEDVIKAVMVGADVANVCSVLLKEGVGKISELLRGHGRLDGRARVRVGRADEGQHEPQVGARAGGL